jgi:hypothetical protein
MGVRLMFDKDRLAQEGDATEEDAATAWWFPTLNAARDPGAKVNAILADFASGGALQNANVQDPPIQFLGFKGLVPALPKKPTGTGFRKGASTLLGMSVAAEFVAYITGHTIGLMSLYHYIVMFLCMIMPGARVLAGRPPPIYGRACGAPPAPSLAALTPLDHEWKGKMQAAIDYCFDINNAAHPKHRRGGSLRVVLEMNMAALIMYYPDMLSDGVLLDVVVKLRLALVTAGLATTVADADIALKLHSARIKAHFELDNIGDVSTETNGIAPQPIAEQVCCAPSVLHTHLATAVLKPKAHCAGSSCDARSQHAGLMHTDASSRDTHGQCHLERKHRARKHQHDYGHRSARHCDRRADYGSRRAKLGSG